MSEMERAVTRRKFIRIAALASAGAALNPSVFGAPEDPTKGGQAKPAAPPVPALPKVAPARAKVVLVRDKAAVDAKGALNAAVLARMLDDAVCALAGNDKPAEAWCQFFGPKDAAGIKTNVWKFLATPPEVEEILK